MPHYTDKQRKGFSDALNKNKTKNFVRRILDPNIYPRIDNKDGTISTHRMASGESDGRYFAYPTIIQDSHGQLQQLKDKEAFNYARQTGESIEFDSDIDAKAFAEGGYKTVKDVNIGEEDLF